MQLRGYTHIDLRCQPIIGKFSVSHPLNILMAESAAATLKNLSTDIKFKCWRQKLSLGGQSHKHNK
jgi:hypothetical protein